MFINLIYHTSTKNPARWLANLPGNNSAYPMAYIPRQNGYPKGVVPLAFRKRCEWFADKIDWCSLYIRNIRDTCVYHSVSMRTRPHLSANALSSVPRIFELHKTLVADDIRWYPHYIRNTFAIRARYIRDTYARLNQCIRDIRNYPQLIRN